MENWIWVVLIVIGILLGGISGYYLGYDNGANFVLVEEFGLSTKSDIVGGYTGSNNRACTTLKSGDVCKLTQSCVWDGNGCSGGLAQ